MTLFAPLTRRLAARSARGIAIALFTLTLGGLMAPNDAKALDPENALQLELANGPVIIELLPDVAPQHVERIKTLARQGFYDGLKWHRVIEGFMAQTGDPGGTGAGGSDLPDLQAEFSAVPFEEGTLGMARTQAPNSANSQWFIVFERSDWLDSQYTVFGQVVEGMENVHAIKKGDRAANGLVRDPDTIVSLRVLADVQ